MWQSSMRFVFRASCIWVWHWMPQADGVKAVQACLRHDNWPVGVSAASSS
jgi:hypothetical protein